MFYVEFSKVLAVRNSNQMHVMQSEHDILFKYVFGFF